MPRSTPEGLRRFETAIPIQPRLNAPRERLSEAQWRGNFAVAMLATNSGRVPDPEPHAPKLKETATRRARSGFTCAASRGESLTGAWRAEMSKTALARINELGRDAFRT